MYLSGLDRARLTSPGASLQAGGMHATEESFVPEALFYLKDCESLGQDLFLEHFGA